MEADGIEAMGNAYLTPDCKRIQEELAGYLYEELSAEARATLERHLEGCAACRDELAALRETRRLLARWETPAAVEDPHELARDIAAHARRAPAPRRRSAPLVRWGAILSGAAAALLFTLSLLHTQVEYDGGRVRVSFALPGAAPSPQSVYANPELEGLVRSIAAQEVSTQAASMRRNHEEQFQSWTLMTKEEQQEQFLRFAQTVDTALNEKQRFVDRSLMNLGREAALADREQRQAISNLAGYIVPASNNR